MISEEFRDELEALQSVYDDMEVTIVKVESEVEVKKNVKIIENENVEIKKVKKALKIKETKSVTVENENAAKIDKNDSKEVPKSKTTQTVMIEKENTAKNEDENAKKVPENKQTKVSLKEWKVLNEIEKARKKEKLLQIPNLHTTLKLSCIPRSSSASFVSTVIEIQIPLNYPLSRPAFRVLKSSGLSDEGRNLETLIRRHIFDSPREEVLLFDLIEKVYEFLDTRNTGECLICSEELATGQALLTPFADSIWDNKSQGLRTSCYHCYHIHCLTRWAAISLSLKDSNKGEHAWIRDRDTNTIRHAEGDVKSTELEICTLEKQQEILQNDINENEILLQQQQLQEKQHQNNIKIDTKTVKNGTNNDISTFKNTKNVVKSDIVSTESSSIVRDIKELRTKLTALVLITQDAKTRTERNKLTEQGNVLRRQLVKEELLLNEIEIKETETENTAQMTIVILDRLKSSFQSTNEKITRNKKKLKNHQDELLMATEKLVTKTRKNSVNRSFPCACCRTELFIENCIPTGDKKEIRMFNLYLDKAVIIYNKELEVDELEKNSKVEKDEKGLETVFDALNLQKDKDKNLKYPSYPNSILTLPLETQMKVREVQRQQQELMKMRYG